MSKTHSQKLKEWWASRTPEELEALKAKRKASIKAKYGVENISQLKEIKEKVQNTLSKRTQEQKQKTIMQRKNTNLKKYGTETPAQSIVIKQKITTNWQNKDISEKQSILNKRKKTNLKKYGVEYSQQAEEVKEKVKQTNLKRYGCTAAIQAKEIQEKVQENNLKKYGTKYAIIAPEIRKKIENTTLQHYGYTNLFLSPEYRKKAELKRKQTIKVKYNATSPIQIPEFKEKAKQTCLDKYGVPYNCMSKNCLESDNNTISKINLAFKKELDQLNIKSKLEFCIDKQNYDFCINKTLIELNPAYTHNSSYDAIFSDFRIKPKAFDYHYNKTKKAIQFGYNCIHVWEWDNKDKILEMLKDKTILYARKLTINKVPEKECNNFLNAFHLQNTCNNQIIRLGLYQKDELIEIMTFGKPRYNKKYEWELLRLCTKAEYKVVGGAEKLFKAFIDQYKPKSIISYCDNSKFTGNVYKRLGMKLLDYGKPAKHWYNIKTKRHITDNLLRQRGYSQLHNDKIYKKGESNEQLMLNAGYVEIYDCGQSVYIKDFTLQ